MKADRTDVLRHLTAINPMLAWWAMPAMMMESWSCAMMGVMRRGDEAERNPTGKGQLPVPANLQDKKDRELFA